MNTYYQVSLNNRSNLNALAESYNSLEEAAIAVYTILFDHVNPTEILIHCYYLGIRASTFKVDYRNGLTFYNNTNNIKVAAIYPVITVLDSLYSEKKQVEVTKENPFITTPKPTVSTKGNPFITSPKEGDKKSPIIETYGDDHYRDDHYSPLVEIDLGSKIPDNVNERERSYLSDKRSYLLIKEDIDKGKLLKDDINPYFVVKYITFKILETRNILDSNSNDNYQKESEIYWDLINSYDEEIQEEPMKEVYVPHNYNYLSEYQKEEYAKKYNLTVREFEEKHVTALSGNNVDKILDVISLSDENDSDTESSVSSTR